MILVKLVTIYLLKNAFKKMSFREFCIANQNYVKKCTCASVKALKIFEKDRPDLANRYFDLKYEEVSKKN